ncbi:DUF72 domain-containing protein [Candidatus Bathyarchaeota archaeon]|nr:DUF72 domain-containing protein [Candidatus Bathyarchaeota archaeon]
MALHVGTMGWSYGFWKGKFYPENLSPKEFLSYYSRKFGTVEVDSTFYRIPSEQTIKNWKEQTSEDFVFSLKFPQVITHIKMLEDCQEETAVFLERASLLKYKLSVLLLQFPYSFKAEKIPLLNDFLQSLPRTHHYAVEVRNRKLLSDNLYSVLRDNNVQLVWVDTPSMPKIDEITSDFIYIRWEGDRRKVKGIFSRREVEKVESIELWAEKIKLFLEKQIEVFGYFSKYYSGYPPSDINDLLNIISEKL